jgi:2-amino-4-hydroxy-6-hydroxymethyldihydropteridine diphosphokinase
MGAREEHVLRAFERISATAGIAVVARSPLYESAAVGLRLSGPFINAAILVETDLDPHRLLAVCLGLEAAAGRERGADTDDRQLDIDIILYGTAVVQSADLVIPHPRFRERSFVLKPLCDIGSDLVIPPGGITVGELADRFEGMTGARLISTRRLIG